ncbi:MAG: ornithine carbamoyltransferase [Pseudomonadales bacterium]|jgi:ornithine carbamoyltransferase|nr:ornithine carbamoyltransferase [Pseudomonadales bacterium]
MTLRHFLSLDDLDLQTFEQIIDRAIALKDLQRRGVPHATLQGRTLAMLFEQPSTRTRVAFETGMTQLGGHALFLTAADTQLGRGELVEDAARVLSQMVDVVMIRTPDQTKIEAFAGAATVPVINAMSSIQHPCQILADMQTFYEHRGPISGRKVAFIGDGFNMCKSYVIASHVFDFDLRVACPRGFEPDAEWVRRYGARVDVGNDPRAAVEGADLVVTDVWASMGYEDQQLLRLRRFQGFQVNQALLDHARDDVLFMHCLPAHRGEEISEDLLEDPRAVVFDEAGNRLHSQKALLEFLLAG